MRDLVIKVMQDVTYFDTINRVDILHAVENDAPNLLE